MSGGAKAIGGAKGGWILHVTDRTRRAQANTCFYRYGCHNTRSTGFVREAEMMVERREVRARHFCLAV